MYENNARNNLIASRQLSRYISRVDDSAMSMETVWCRMVYSDFENMLAPNVWHAVYEIQYCLEGAVDFTVQEQRYTVHEGEFLIIPPKVFHSTDRVATDTQKFVFAFSIEGRTDYIVKVLESLRQIRVYRGGEHLRHLISLMLEYAYISSPVSGEAIRNLSELLIFEFFRRVYPCQEEKALKIRVFESDRRINEMATFIRENISSNITCEDVAEYLHICPRHINRISKRETGYTVTQLINNEKISYIKRLLRGDMPLLDVALKANFSSEYTLNRFFKRHEGLSIGAWRRSVEK